MLSSSFNNSVKVKELKVHVDSLTLVNSVLIFFAHTIIQNKHKLLSFNKFTSAQSQKYGATREI